MFGFLKDKVKSAISSFTKKFDEEAELVDTPKQEGFPEALQEEAKEILEEKKETKKAIEKKKEEKKQTHTKEEPKKEEKTEEKKGFFAKVAQSITTKKISESQFEELFWDMEVELLESNVAFEVIEKIKVDLKKNLVDVPLKRGEVENIIQESLKESILELLDLPDINLIELIKAKKDKPFVIVFFGINGAGKTTSISKIAHLCQRNNLSVVLGAGDSFRMAAIEQLEEWGRRLEVKVVKQKYGADCASVCFDTISFAKGHNIHVALLDTAGRQHSNTDLMNELQKIVRVTKPDLRIFVAESISGNDAVEQAKLFNEKIGIDAVFLTKADIDEKGGTMISMSYVTKKPILFLGSGQNPEDLKKFRAEDIMKNLLS